MQSPPSRPAGSANVTDHPGPAAAPLSGDEPDLTGHEFQHDPCRAYGRLREQGPVVRGWLSPEQSVWLITRFADVRAVLRDHRFVNSPLSVPGHTGPDPRKPMLSALGLPERLHPYFLRSVVDSDPPGHTVLRGLVSRAFTARRIRALRPRVAQIADRLLSELPGYAENGVADLVRHFAYPLPIAVICELVGIPEPDRPLWTSWSEDLLALDPGRLSTSTPSLVDSVHAAVEARRRCPTDDLLSGLIQAADGSGGGLADGDIVTMVLILVLAGHETTAHLISNGTAALLGHPDQLGALRADPGLLPGAVEELMRWCGPVQLARTRYAAEDVDLHGVRIRRGDTVQCVLVSANHDPRQYTAPERLDLTRHRGASAETHLGFGHGIHFCLGAPLARQEGEVAFHALWEHFPRLSLAVPRDSLERLPASGGWRLARLPLRLGPHAFRTPSG